MTYKETRSELAAMRNELCCKCGNYREAHNGACDGCRWGKAALKGGDLPENRTDRR